MLRTRENHHDPTLLLFCTLYYLKNIPRIRPRLQRCQQAEWSGDTCDSPLPSSPQPSSNVFYVARRPRSFLGVPVVCRAVIPSDDPNPQHILDRFPR